MKSILPIKYTIMLTTFRSWREVVVKDCQARKLNSDDAVDCGRWRKLIKDVC